jgi:diguanylate cyclase (GGDEF)-like protein
MAGNANGGWSFTVKIVAPVIATSASALLICVGFMLWSASRIDAGAIDIQKRVVTHMVESERAALPAKQMGYGAWDEAVVAATQDDLGWLAANYGADAFERDGFDRAYLLTPDLKPVFAMRNGGKVAPETYAADEAAIAPVVAQHRSVNGQAAISAYNEGIAEIPVSSAAALIDGRPAIVSAVPLLGESNDVLIEAIDAYLYVAISFLTVPDPAIAGDIPAIAAGAYLPAAAPIPDGDTMVPILGAAGDTIGKFVWRADRPAVRMTYEALPALAAVVLIIGLLMARLLWRLRKATAELEQAREQAVHLALHDPLTGLANRAMFQKRLTTALEDLNRGGSPIALLALDLDRFKQVNDTLGHEAGDELLRQVAMRLKSLLSDQDAVARLGGDEFVVLQNAIKTVSEARHLSERIIEAIGVPFRLAEHEVSVGVSIGVAIAKDAARDGIDLPARADFALYQAKESGRNTYRLYETDLARPEPVRNADAAA